VETLVKEEKEKENVIIGINEYEKCIFAII
jgi:hypothetical protein